MITKEKSSDSEKRVFLCPMCNGQTKEVEEITVRHFLLDSLVNKEKNSDYRICLNESCNVVYYDIIRSIVFNKQDMKIPIWYKKGANPKYICYCNQVTEEQIINAVLNDGAKDLKDIIRLTGAMKNGNCKVNNPLSKCCGPNIQEVINKTLNIKKYPLE